VKVEFTSEQVAVMQTALDKWGLAAQAGQTVEECAELIVALQKRFNRVPPAQTIEDIADEMADVEMMLAQMRLAFAIDDESFHRRIEGKFKKLGKYLRDC
jgi:NTP pyrophosphatase (non-canonical NTP hydrolase)